MPKLHFITASLLSSQNPNPQARPPLLRPPVQATETFAGKYIYCKKSMLQACRVDLCGAGLHRNLELSLIISSMELCWRVVEKGF